MSVVWVVDDVLHGLGHDFVVFGSFEPEKVAARSGNEAEGFLVQMLRNMQHQL